MTKFEQVADEAMVKNAVGDEFDEMAEPPEVEISDHPIARMAVDALRKVFDYMADYTLDPAVPLRPAGLSG